MKKKYIFLFLVVSNILYAQKNLKTSRKSNGVENEIFTYYTDSKSLNLNIKHGNYSYESKRPNFKWSIKGKFIEDKKVGRWTSDFVQITSKDGGLTIKTSKYSHIDWTEGSKINGEFLTVTTEENFNGITRVALVSNKCLWKYNNNFIRSIECSKNENGLESTMVKFQFDENGFLLPGAYCFKDCLESKKYILKVDVDKFATQIPEDQYYNSSITGDDIDDNSTLIAKKYLRKQITEEELSNQNIELDKVDIFNLLRVFSFDIGEDKEFIEHNGQLIGIKGGGNMYGKYTLHRNIKLGNELIGTWKLKQMISNNESIDVPQNAITFSFLNDNLTIYQNKNGLSTKVENGNYYIADGKKNLISLREDNGKYSPAFSVLELQENKTLKIKSLPKNREKEIIYVLQK